jgi:hypothetical protein
MASAAGALTSGLVRTFDRWAQYKPALEIEAVTLTGRPRLDPVLDG